MSMVMFPRTGAGWKRKSRRRTRKGGSDRVTTPDIGRWSMRGALTCFTRFLALTPV